MKIVLDTNVLVSAFLKIGSPPERILRLLLQGEIQIVIDGRILKEYREVLGRPKFGLDGKLVESILGLLAEEGLYAPAYAGNVQLPDEDDLPFLEAALAAGVDALITGKLIHYPTEARQGIVVVSPAEFLGLYF